MIISFTGHRPNKIGGYNPNPIQKYIYDEIKTLLLKLGPKEAISGMALGVDQIAAEVCVDINIPFIAAVPFKGQESRWPINSQIKYNNILNKAKEIKTICSGNYARWKMQKRNEWMVDNSDILIAVYNEFLGTGGTKNCIDYAESIKRKIIRIDPLKYSTK